MVKLFLACLLTLTAALAVAGEAKPVAADPALEKRVMAVSEELRCLVCQNQTIADSNADLAIDLRNQVREKLAAGMSDQDVAEYMVQRYGDFILYRPPLKGITWLLWFGPFLLLIGGVSVLGFKLAARRRQQMDTLPEADQRRAAQLLDAGAETIDAKEKK